MARTIQQIADEIKVKIITNQPIRSAFGVNNNYFNFTGTPLQYYNENVSEASVITQIIWVVATCIATLENMFDWHKAEVDRIVNHERFGYAGWYRKMALLFQYGDNIVYDYSENGEFAEKLTYSEIDETKRVVKNAIAIGCDNGVLLKITGENNEPITEDQLVAFTAYINRIKPAGIPIVVRNWPADQIFIKCKIQYNPLVLNNNGALINSPGNKPVLNAIRSYINSISFNGELSHQKLEDAIQVAEGVELVGHLSIQARQGTNQPIEVPMKYIPQSGYLFWDESDNSLNNNSIDYIIS